MIIYDANCENENFGMNGFFIPDSHYLIGTIKEIEFTQIHLNSIYCYKYLKM